MKTLFIAPEICTPYSEGRKRFVLDLLECFRADNQVFLLTTTKKGQETHLPSIDYKADAFGYGFFHLFFLIRNLPLIIKEFKPDVVYFFPYGTFKGLYGLILTWFMTQIDRTCERCQISCLTIMYAIDQYQTYSGLKKKVRNLAVSQHEHWKGPTVNVGIRYKHWSQQRNESEKESSDLLFMSGAWLESRKLFDYVLYERGLDYLLKAGRILSEKNVNLIIATPLSNSSKFQNYIINAPQNSWAKGQIKFLGEVNVPAVYYNADLYVFPYQKHMTQFIPTSVLESMFAGTCVALSNIDFLKPLANGGKTAYQFPIDDPDSMAEVLLAALGNREERLAIASRAKEYAKQHWSIESSMASIKDCVKMIQSNDNVAE